MLKVKNSVVNHWHECESKEVPLWWQDKGLQYTATGYGAKIPTRYKVYFSGKWRRVYCRVYSNIGTLYILVAGEKYFVEEA